MLVALHERGDLDLSGITTRLQLFDGFYAAVRREAEARQPGVQVGPVSDRLAVILSDRQELSVAKARLGDYQTTVENLASAGWLRIDHGRVAFAHEAFFDYAYAQQHLRTGVPLLEVLRNGEQHLFRRAQVRQILALEREQDRRQYLDDVREILAGDDVRPHLKELVVALVTLVEAPGLDEWQALSVLGDPVKDSLAERAYWLAARAPGFGQLLLDNGIVGEHLAGPGTADLGIWLCTLMVRDHPDEVASLLLPYVGQDGWSDRLARVLNAALLGRSEPVVNLMIAFIDAGGFDDNVRSSTRRSGDVFSMMHGFNGESAASGSRLLAAWLRRRLTLLTADGAYDPSAEPADTGGTSAGGGPGLAEQAEEGADRDD
jgi:hypothetical protein